MADRKKKTILLLVLGAAAVAIGVAIWNRRKKKPVPAATTPSGGTTYTVPVDSDGKPRPAEGWVLMYGPDGKRHWMPPYAMN